MLVNVTELTGMHTWCGVLHYLELVVVCHGHILTDSVTVSFQSTWCQLHIVPFLNTANPVQPISHIFQKQTKSNLLEELKSDKE